jgi:hypothetical protein
MMMKSRSPNLFCLIGILVLICLTVPLIAQTRVGGRTPPALDRYWRGVSGWYAELDYGSGTINHISSTSRFANPGLLELRFGVRDLKLVRRGVMQSEEQFIQGQWYSSDVPALREGREGMRLKMPRIGLGSRTGYGYQWGSAMFFPYHQLAVTFTNIQPAYSSSVPDADRAIADRYKGPFRVGLSLEGGFRFHVSRVLSFQAGVEGSVVYPRFVFPKWSGSFMATVTGFVFASRATESVLASSPLFTPIFHFLLKNSLSFLLYQVLKKNSHWPFRSEPPLTIATIKAGFALGF